MNKKPFMRSMPLLAVSAIVLIAFRLSAAESEAPSSTPDNDAAMRAMGFAMASQLRLEIGFTDEELNAVFEGMRMVAEGAEQPEGFQEAIQQAQQIYMTRMQAFQLEEQQRAAQLAEQNKSKNEKFFEDLDQKEGVKKTLSGLRYEILEEGSGSSPTPNDRVKVNYRGTLIDGREFDANNNAEFMVSRVVTGFSEGLQLLKEGGKARIYIPAELGYGNSPSRPGSIIQPGDALIFELELLEVIPIPPPPSGPPPQLPENLQMPEGSRQLPTNIPPPPSGPPPSPPPSSIPATNPPSSPPARNP